MFDSGGGGDVSAGPPQGLGSPSSSTAPAVVPPAPSVLQLGKALSALLDVDPVRLPEAQSLADARELLALQARFEALLLRRLGDVDTRKLHRLDGNATTSSWARAQGGDVDAVTITLARRLSRLPGVEFAVRAGTLSTAAAAKVGTALTKLRPLMDRADGLIDGQPGEATVAAVVVDGVLGEVGQYLGGVADDDPRILELQAQLSEISCWPASQLARLEAAFVLLAQQLPLAHLPAGLAMLVDALLPNELEKRAAAAAQEASLSLRQKSDGSGWTIHGDLDLETGELAHAALTAASATDPDNPADTSAGEKLRAAGWEFGDPIPEGLDAHGRPWDAPRSRGRRMHDALTLTLRALLDSGALGTRDRVAPHIAVTTGLDSLHQDPGARPATGASGARLPLSLVRTWWCDSYVTRYVLGLGHRVLEASHTSRTLKPHERRVKHLETGGHCQGAGCCRGPGHPLIPHHVDAFARCGTTSLRDTVLFCEQDHAALHRGHTITLKDGRRLNEQGWVR